ncbi:hypothetical protein CTEN210_11644 [Chaetoceros tenuissimus]|uniref:G-protein coupled receptors family 1 profile domain-containing protein n=1 Tax=Chaetoceros tenuissimus TaxID=426638 RepID=A0AAD3D015_9STRA|nr:hypothetical protein CTEN210_11644 [Chaetoceros tenuissimus]
MSIRGFASKAAAAENELITASKKFTISPAVVVTRITQTARKFPTRSSIKTLAIVQTVSSSISLIATITVICMIARSHTKLSSTFHRLLFGLCISDLFSSLGVTLSTIPIPSKYNQSIWWNAQGTIETCTTQGLFIFVGLRAEQFYNCSLCLYYLFVIKYNKKEDYIRKYVEPWLHSVPIFLSLLFGIIIAAKDSFNPGLTFCGVGADPPGCISNDALECTRGRDAQTMYKIFAAVPYVVLPFIIVFTMGLMYHAARQNERKMSGYGIHTLRLRADTNTDDNNNADGGESEKNLSESRISKRFKEIFSFRFSQSTPSQSRLSRSNKLNKQSKMIVQRALAYSLAYLFSYIVPLIISIMKWRGETVGYGITLVSRILFPLQGFFNFLVFIFPRILNARKRNANLSWSRAFVHALKSRGQRPRGTARNRLSQQN